MMNIAPLVKKIPFEILFVGMMFAIMMLLSFVYRLPVVFPSGERAAFVGIHYLYPLIGVAIWGVFAFFGQRRQLMRTFLIALPCYAAVLLVHFNLKLWVPYINPHNFDAYLWAVDTAFRPVIDLFFAIRHALAPVIALDGNFYMIGFIMMFYVSFCYHAVFSPVEFRQLFLAALIFQGLGALAYLLFPAVGPFVYEQGSNALMTNAQEGMLSMREAMMAHGPGWLQAEGSVNLTAGLAAMPSLHAGGAFLFFLFALRHGRPMVPLYAFLLGFIMVEAVTTRWHYLIDLPVGMALAWLSCRLGERMVMLSDGETESVPVPVEDAVPQGA